VALRVSTPAARVTYRVDEFEIDIAAIQASHQQ
jgi:hypothetical protein